MAVLTPADIASLRETVRELFPDSADIYHRTNAGGSAYGGSAPAYPGAPDIADVPVLFVQRSVRELAEADIELSQISQVLLFPGGVDVRQTDRVVIGADTWEVTSVEGGGSWEVTKNVTVRRVL